MQKKYAPALAGLVGWAAGGSAGGLIMGRSPEQAEAEDRLRQVAAHRESVLWLLRQRLQLCGHTQQHMMEARLTREMEKNRSVLAKARLDARLSSFPAAAPYAEPARSRPPDEQDAGFAAGLNEEQLQMFERDNPGHAEALREHAG